MKKIIESFRQVGIILAFLLSTTIMFAQQKVTGVVKSAYNEPLIGVNVVVKGSTQGTVTDLEGRYSIDVPDSKSILEFTYIGFVPQQVAVGSKSTIDITLIEDSKALEEVVVVGYGTVKKSDLTGAVSSIKSEELQKNTIFYSTQMPYRHLARSRSMWMSAILICSVPAVIRLTDRKESASFTSERV